MSDRSKRVIIFQMVHVVKKLAEDEIIKALEEELKKAKVAML